MAIALRQSRLITLSSTFLTPPSVVDTSLLAGETDGLAINFTDTTYFNLATGSQLWNQVRTASVDSLTSPHTFYTQSGTSPKMVKTSSTGLGWSPHNMFLNSDSPATQNVTLVTGFVYTFGVTGAGTLTGSSGASGAATAGSPVTFTATGTTGTFTVSGGTPTTMQINRGSVLTTYLLTAGSIVNGLPISYGAGLLVEPAATNMLIRSEDLDNVAQWDSANSTFTLNATTAPDGTVTADLLTVDTATGVLRGGVATTASVNYTTSIFAKFSNTQWMGLQFRSTAGADRVRAWFDVQNGITGTNVVAGAGVFVSSSIESIGNGWYRCVVTGNISSTDNEQNTFFADADGSLVTAAGNAGYLWGAQMELGTVATSYIPTVSATATRATDLPNVATSAYPHSDTNGTFIVWFTKRIANATNADRIINVNDGTANELHSFDVVTGDTPDSVGLDTVDGGSPQVVSTTTKSGSITTAGNEGAFFYTLNDSGVLMDGGSEVVDAACTMPTVTNLQLGYAQDTASRTLNGIIRRLIYVPRRMTQTEMQSKTT